MTMDLGKRAKPPGSSFHHENGHKVYHGIPWYTYMYVYIYILILIDCIISVLDKPKLYRICRYWQGSGKDGKEG